MHTFVIVVFCMQILIALTALGFLTRGETPRPVTGGVLGIRLLISIALAIWAASLLGWV